MIKKVNASQDRDPSNLAQKAGYNQRIAEIQRKILDHDHSNKYNTTQEFNKLTAENTAARLKQVNSATKANIDELVKKDKFW